MLLLPPLRLALAAATTGALALASAAAPAHDSTSCVDVVGVQLQVDDSQAIAQTHDAYIGLNIETFPESYRMLREPKVRFLISQLAPSVLRVGGNSADDTAWNVTNTSSTAAAACGLAPICVQTEDVRDIFGFANTVGWRVMLNLNEWFPYAPGPVVDPDAGKRPHRPGPFVNSNNLALLR